MSETYSAVRIDEYGVYAGGSQTFPKYPPQSYGEAIKSIDYFVSLEARRLQDLQGANSLVVVDRTYLSCLAFDYAARQFSGFDIYNEAEEAWAKAHRIEPDLILFLDVSDRELDLRIAPDKHKYLPHFYQPSFNAMMRQYYSEKSAKDNRILWINADQPVKCVYADAIEVISKRAGGGK